MKKVVKNSSSKYVTENTFEQNMQSIAKSFSRVDTAMERHEMVLQEILKEIRNIHEDNKYFRQSISNISIDNSSNDRKIENLTLRVEKLELKNK